MENMRRAGREEKQDEAIRTQARSISGQNIPLMSMLPSTKKDPPQAVDGKSGGVTVAVLSPKDEIVQQPLNIVETGSASSNSSSDIENHQIHVVEAERERKKRQSDVTNIKEIICVAILILTSFLLILLGITLYYAFGYQTQNETTPLTDMDFRVTTPFTNMDFNVTTPVDFNMATVMTASNFNVRTSMDDLSISSWLKLV